MASAMWRRRRHSLSLSRFCAAASRAVRARLCSDALAMQDSRGGRRRQLSGRNGGNSARRCAQVPLVARRGRAGGAGRARRSPSTRHSRQLFRMPLGPLGAGAIIVVATHAQSRRCLSHGEMLFRCIVELLALTKSLECLKNFGIFPDQGLRLILFCRHAWMVLQVVGTLYGLPWPTAGFRRERNPRNFGALRKTPPVALMAIVVQIVQFIYASTCSSPIALVLKDD